MCAVSMIFDYGKNRIDPLAWNWPKWEEFLELIERTKKFDEKMEQPDCEDEAKGQWMDETQARLLAEEIAKIEKKLRKLKKRAEKANVRTS